jgi:hypothetical protein
MIAEHTPTEGSDRWSDGGRNLNSGASWRLLRCSEVYREWRDYIGENQSCMLVRGKLTPWIFGEGTRLT